MDTSRPASGYGSGRSSTDRTTVKMAVLAPMHSASVRRVVRAKARSFQRSRNAKTRSCRSLSIHCLRARGAYLRV